MMEILRKGKLVLVFLCALSVSSTALAQSSKSQIGREVAIPRHLQDGEEFTISLNQLINYGLELFTAKFTIQEGAGRPLTKGTGAPVADPSSPLVFPRNFDRLSSKGTAPPTLVVRPFHQASNIVSLRQFSTNAFNHHHGMQAEERFGLNADPDGDGFSNELTAADLTAVSIYQATLAVPGRVIPNDPAIERANVVGEALFNKIGCASCHATLPLTANNNPGLPGQPGWVYFEPNPYNPNAGPNTPNLQLGPANYPASAPALPVDLSSDSLPQPRLKAKQGVIMVSAYTDLKVHDISATSDPATDPECEPLDQNQPAGSPGFFKGNCKFMTRKLWGFYNQGGAFMHHGKFTTAREAVEAHFGEALVQKNAFDALPADQQDALIEFLKSLQVLAPGSRSLVVDERGNPKRWPPSEDRSN